MPYWKALVWFLTITSVFMSASYTMLVPFLPMYLIDELGVAQSDVNIWSGLIFSISFFHVDQSQKDTNNPSVLHQLI